MNPYLNIAFTEKILEACGADKSAAVYSLVPLIDKEPYYFEGVYAFNLGQMPKIVDSAVEILSGRECSAQKSSYEFGRIFEKKEEFLKIFSNVIDSKNLEEGGMIVSEDKALAALAMLSAVYLRAFVKPVQFFLPNSSVCCGEWEMWEKLDYLNFVERAHQKIFSDIVKEKIVASRVWNLEMKPEEFPLIVKRRLIKEEAFGKKLDPYSMIKAMIIHFGKKTQPSISYEMVDFSIRSFFTYLNYGKYIRVDREIELLKRLDKELFSAISRQIEN